MVLDAGSFTNCTTIFISINIMSFNCEGIRNCRDHTILCIRKYVLRYIMSTGTWTLDNTIDILGTINDNYAYIDFPTYQNGHLLDYVITRRDSDFASNCTVADKISDHMALHVS